MAVLTVAANGARAEKVLATVDGWQIYSDGRAGGFISYVHGDGYPQPDYGRDAMGNFVTTPVDTPQEGAGFRSVGSQSLAFDPGMTGNQPVYTQGTIDLWRLRSGFISNVFGFGGRGPLTGSTNLTVYVQFWAFVENNNRQKNTPNYPDARQGYAKLDGPWGSFTMGRTRTLFSRGATDIDVLYAHRWGLGWPGKLDNNGPTSGQLGFGVLGSGFSSSIIYGTPTIRGFQLNIGLFDPVQLQGDGAWTRTGFARPEAELTFERSFGSSGWGKIVLFANGAYQKVYKDSYCVPVLDSDTMKNIPCEQSVAGAGFGGRLELGPVHLGVAGHYGRGLGMYYAVEASDAAQDKEGNLRTISGTYVQSQVVLGKVDLFAGWGIAQVFLTDYDGKHKVQDPRDPMNPAARVLPFSVPKYQMGVNAGIVYNVSPALHVDLDFFRAEAAWYGVNGFAAHDQVVLVGNGGMTINW
ncbi:MAG: porin [Myxococcales bacterium]